MLSHDRPYRPARAFTAVTAAIREGASPHFDPGVAAAFLALAQEAPPRSSAAGNLQ